MVKLGLLPNPQPDNQIVTAHTPPGEIRIGWPDHAELTGFGASQGG